MHIVKTRGLRVVVTLAIVCVWTACGEQGAEQMYSAAVSAAHEAAADSAALSKAIPLFDEFVERYPESERAAEALKTLAMLTQQSGDMSGAVTQYERLLAEYPNSEHADEAQFMIGFVYEEYLGDIARARTAYEKVIEHFPDSELAANARQLLPNLGRPRKSGSISRKQQYLRKTPLCFKWTGREHSPSRVGAAFRDLRLAHPFGKHTPTADPRGAKCPERLRFPPVSGSRRLLVPCWRYCKLADRVRLPTRFPVHADRERAA